MTRPILIGMQVELDQATGEIKRFVDTAKQGAQQAGRSLKQAGDQAEQAARTAVPAQQQLQRTTKSTAESFNGAGAAISGAAAAVQSFGVQGGPITTLASSLSALAVSGTGPLALAVAGVTAFSLVLSDISADSGPIDRAREKIDALRKSTSDLLLEMRGLQSGLGTRRQGLVEQIAIQRERIDNAVNSPIVGDFRQRGLFGGSRFAGGISAIEEELAKLDGDKSTRAIRERRFLEQQLEIRRKSLFEDQQILRQLERQLETLDRIREAREKESAEEKRRTDALRNGFSFANPGAFQSLLGGGFGSTFRQFAAQAGAQGGRIGIGPARQAPLAPVDAESLALAELDERARADKLRQVGTGLDSPDLAGFRAQRLADVRAQMDALESERRELESRFRSSGLGFAEGMKDGLSRLLSGELDDPLLALTSLISRSFSDAVAEGVIEGLGVRESAASITEGISNFLSGGLGGKTSSGTKLTGIESGIDIAFPELAGLEAAAGPGKREFIVVPTDSPDAVAAKLSQSGARAVVAKAFGSDGGAGAIPARRR